MSTLEALTAGCRCVTPAEVLGEIVAGVGEHPTLAKAVGLTWVEVVELTEIQEIVEFARYKAEFGGGQQRNNGEAAVLAWSSVHCAIAIIDERVATRAARRDGILVHGTMWLIANGVRSGTLTRESAEQLVDDLVATDMTLPVDGSGFFAWAYSEGLLP